MAIYFSNTLSKEPFQFDSVGNHWLQEALSRPQGYPIYHYLQTEEGCGIFTIDGKEYFFFLFVPLYFTSSYFYSCQLV